MKIIKKGDLIIGVQAETLGDLDHKIIQQIQKSFAKPSSAFHCEPCDRDFASKDSLMAHERWHVRHGITAKKKDADDGKKKKRRVACPQCGKMFKSLKMHLHMAHGEDQNNGKVSLLHHPADAELNA